MRDDRRSTRRNPRYNRSSSRYRGRYEEPSSGGGMILILIGILLVGGYFLLDENNRVKAQEVFNTVKAYLLAEEPEPQASLPTSTTPTTQANVVKVLAYTFYEEQMVEGTQDEAVWYEKYYEQIAADSRFAFLKKENATKPMTYQDTYNVLQAIVGEEHTINVGQPEVLNQYITLNQFLTSYEEALTTSNMQHNLQYKDLSILGTLATQKTLKPWEVVTNEGVYGFEGLIIDPYKDYTLGVLVKGDEVLGIVDITSVESQLQQCYVKEVGDGEATIQIGNFEFKYKNKVLTSKDTGQMATIVVKNSEIIDYNLQGEKDTDRVLKVDEDTIEFLKAGKLPYKELLIYNDEEGKYKDLKEFFSGIEVSFTEENGYVKTIKVIEDKETPAIRVVISENGMASYNHEDVTISGKDYVISYGDNKWTEVGDKQWVASAFEWKKDLDKVTLIPKEKEGLTIESITRQGKAPTYKGTLEIYKVGDGYQIVNEVDLEDYIAAVISSEMPTSYGYEAAKVQAVAARSFVISHQKSSKFLKYGAQVDDTVSTQVYNNVAADDTSRKAAQETKGEVLMYNDQIISGNFFATSCGYTANFGETWAKGEIFPTNTPVYLVARQQYVGERDNDNLTDEEQAANFFKQTAKEVDAFDKDSPWFRWQVQLTKEELSHIVNTNVYRLTTNYPNMVKIKNEEDKWVVGEIKSIGDVEKIEVTKRGKGGNAMEMVVTGEDITLKVSTEYLIRNLLAPIQKDVTEESIKVVRADDSEIENMSMLPSAFFAIDTKYNEDNLASVTLYGGGFGHGVGMSQDGVKGMAELGYTYKEILSHYYGETKVKQYF